MKVVVDYDLCEANAVCMGVAPEIFRVEEDDTLTILMENPPESERAKWAAALPDIAGNWANDMQAQGLPGRAILRDYMQIMRKADQPIARQWDQ